MEKNEIVARAKRAKADNKDKIITQFCTGQKVLDVGCIGQDRNYAADNWLHEKVKRIAQKIDGVDILEDEIKILRKNGYSIYTIEELQATNNRYDVVLMADVIEHVNDPVAFLSFYAQFLSPTGVMLITTPNANRANNFINILFNNNYSVNPEHTFWFCPRTFAEVVQRAQLNVKDFRWASHYYTSSRVSGVYQKFKFALSNLLISWRSNFNPNMIFILTAKTAKSQ
jgi:2-polyprenyl-3-methyl-5-hydroxy-6-metoxy-1,4-benzoquinol methylase